MKVIMDKSRPLLADLENITKIAKRENRGKESRLAANE